MSLGAYLIVRGWMNGDPKPTPPMVAIGVVLADCNNGKTGLCCPSIKTIAEATGLDDRSISRNVASMKSLGLIAIRTRPKTRASSRSSNGRVVTPMSLGVVTPMSLGG